jgi:small subunit ribosomal protein S8
MTMTDPIADMLTRVRNANLAMHDEVIMPSSKLKEALAALLEKEGYIAGWSAQEATDRPGRLLSIEMKYSESRERVISGIERISKPGLRVYSKANGVPRVLGGLGVAVVSTSKGLMTDREARRQRMGGEVLCYVW